MLPRHFYVFCGEPRQLRLALGLSMAAAALVPIACGGQDEEERATEGPVGEVQSPAIAHDLTWKIGTSNSGAAYIQECQAAGVPVPESIVDPTDTRWIYHGEVQNEFLFEAWKAELWSYEDPNVDGVCVSLPRWNEDDEAPIFGTICLGRATSTICFWENIHDVQFFTRSQLPIPTTSFLGGAALPGIPGKFANEPCSDCHAGDDPFIVHPDEPAFQDFLSKRDSTPQAWPRPIVKSNWPGNPGPIEQIGPAPPNQVRCDSCHKASRGIRFPFLSNDLPGYCFLVLTATGSGNTMPQGGGDGTAHTNWLLSLCGLEPTTGTTVPVDSFEPEVLSPPMVGPVNKCSTEVLVSGLVYGAQVNLSVDGTAVSIPNTATDSEMVVEVGAELVKGQEISVSQSKGTLTSATSETVVRDPFDHVYPVGLPPPVIDPTPLYESAKSLAVGNILGGVELIVEKRHEGTLQATYTRKSAVNHTWVKLFNEQAFNVGDSFTVFQQICGEEDRSPPSQEVIVHTAPNVLPQLVLVPFQHLIEGQQLAEIGSIVQGSQVWVDHIAQPIINSPSVGYNRLRFDLAGPLGRPVLLSDSNDIFLDQALNSVSPSATTIVVNQCNPSNLIAKIWTPFGGEEVVGVAEAVAGATIHVLASWQHVGTGSGYVIPMTRPLVTGEFVQVIEELAGCVGTMAWEIEVQ